MTERTRTWRWTDVLGVVGLVLLVTSMAVSAASPVTEGAHEIPHAPPRVGDRADYVFLMAAPHVDPVEIGPLVTLERRAANETEQAFGAAFAEELTYHERNVRFPLGVINSSAHKEVLLIDAQGHLLGVHIIGQVARDPSHAATDTQPMNRFVTLDAWHSTAKHDVRKPYTVRPYTLSYAPDAWSQISTALRANIALDGPGTIPVTTQARLGQTELYTFSHGAAPQSHLEVLYSIMGIESNAVPCFDRAGMWVDGWTGWNIHLRTDPQETTCKTTTSYWYTPGFADVAGWHYDGIDQDGGVWSLDLVARDIQRGDGPTFPQAATPTPVHDADLPRLALRQIGDDPRPTIHGLTLPDIRDIMTNSEPPAVVRRALQSATPIIGFAWDANTPTTSRAGTTEALRLVPLADNEAPITTHTTDWHILFMDDAGLVTTARFRLESNTPSGSHSLTSWIPCPTMHPDCATQQISPEPNLDQTIVDPWALLDQTRTRIATMPLADNDATAPTPDTFGVLPGFPTETSNTMTRIAAGYLVDIEHEQPPRIDGRYGSDTTNTHRVIWNHGGDAATPESDRQASGAYSLATGREAYSAWWDNGDAQSPTPIASAATPSDGIQVIDVPSRLPGQAGFLLVVIAALARLWSALGMGAHFPFVAWLYAKIRDADVLLHERRSAILAALRTDPGLTASELSKRLGWAWGATVHHLDRLSQAGIVRGVRDGRRRRFVVVEDSVDANRALAASPERARLLTALTKEPGLSTAELATRLSRDRTSVSRLAAQLVDLGALERRRDGRKVRFYPTTPDP